MKKPYDLRERTFLFAQEIISICELTKQTVASNVIIKQLIRSCCSVGAHVHEADGAVTKKDKKNKFVNARKELKETFYWLRLLATKYVAKEKIEPLLVEARELNNILSTIIEKL